MTSRVTVKKREPCGGGTVEKFNPRARKTAGRASPNFNLINGYQVCVYKYIYIFIYAFGAATVLSRQS